VKTTVELDLKNTRSRNPDEGKYAQIARSRLLCGLLFPTELNEELKRHVEKDFEIDVVEEGDYVR
jgi:hypothetical protein